MTKVCFGCGSKLQSEDVEKNGYIPAKRLKDSHYCQRCFKIIHYGMEFNSSTPKETTAILRALNQGEKVVVFLIDFLNINMPVVELFRKIKQSKLLLVSKCDIIPKSIKEERIIDFIRRYYSITEPIKMISSYHHDDVEALTKYFIKNNIHEAYIVGLSNAGKSTLVNKLIEVNHANMAEMTTSYLPNTTLDFIRIQITKELLIIDSPGFVIPSINNQTLFKKNNIKQYLKPKTYQMKANETLKVEDMYFNFSEDTSVTLYMANALEVSKYYKPIEFELQTALKGNVDLIISGLGFLTVKDVCRLKTANIPAELMEVRESIFGDYRE